MASGSGQRPSEWDALNRGAFIESNGSRSTPVKNTDSLPNALSSNTSKAGQIVAALEKISDTLREANLLDEIGLSFPEIAVVGQESTGKSSVLERVLGLPLFPRGADIVTRMAIRLKLSHLDEAGLATFCQTHTLRPDAKGFYLRVSLLRVSYSNTTEVTNQTKFEGPYDPTAGNLHTQGPADRIHRLMMEQVTAGGTNGGVCEDKVLQVEIKARRLSNLTLLDLPGVVGGSVEGEPRDMADRTRRLVTRHLQLPDTLVLVVAEATASSIRNSLAFQLVADADKTTKACGVLTNSDGCVGPSLARLRERLTGQAKDLPTLGFGYIGVVNRDSRDPQQKQTTIDVAGAAESKWFKSFLPDLAAANGGPVLVQKLVTMLEDYVKNTWADKALQLLRAERTKAQASLTALGPPVLGEAAQRRVLDDIVASLAPLFASTACYNSPTMQALDSYINRHVKNTTSTLDEYTELNPVQQASLLKKLADQAKSDVENVIATTCSILRADDGKFYSPILEQFELLLTKAGQSLPLRAVRFQMIRDEVLAIAASNLTEAASSMYDDMEGRADGVRTANMGNIMSGSGYGTRSVRSVKDTAASYLRGPLLQCVKFDFLAALNDLIYDVFGSPDDLVYTLLERQPLAELMKEDEATQRSRAKLGAALVGLDGAITSISSILGRPA